MRACTTCFDTFSPQQGRITASRMSVPSLSAHCSSFGMLPSGGTCTFVCPAPIALSKSALSHRKRIQHPVSVCADTIYPSLRIWLDYSIAPVNKIVSVDRLSVQVPSFCLLLPYNKPLSYPSPPSHGAGFPLSIQSAPASPVLRRSYPPRIASAHERQTCTAHQNASCERLCAQH